MKKTRINRLMAIVVAVLLMIGVFTGCTGEMPKEFGGNATSDTAKTTETTEVPEEVVSETEEVAEETEEVTEETEQVTEETEEGYYVPFVEVIDEVIYVDVEYFLKRATITFADGTAALRAIGEGMPVVLDDVHAIAERGNHRDNTMMLPIKGGNVAVTFDGNVATAATLHSHKGEWALCKAEKLETGYELVEKPKDKTEGEWLQITAVCVENAEADFGYDFYILVNEECVPEVVYTPVYTPQKPVQPEEPEVEEPEVEVEDPTEEPEKDPVRPGGGGGNKPDDKPETPENNPPIEEDPDTPEEPVIGVPENNPPIEDTPTSDGPQPPADMNPDNNAPADMAGTSTNTNTSSAPSDMGTVGVSVSTSSTSVSESSAPADMGGSTNVGGNSGSRSTSSGNRTSSAPESSGPADMA